MAKIGKPMSASAPRHQALAALIASGLSLLILPLNPAQAAGYRFGTQSAAGEGTANANGAEGADASTIFANPAAITRLSGWQFSGVLDYVKPNVRFTDQGSTIALPGSGFQPVPISKVGDTQSPTSNVLVPHLYGSYKYSDTLAYGIGAFVPYGAKLDYQPSWGGRYNLNAVELKSFAVNPNVAWKPSQSLSLALGLTAQYMEGSLKRATPYGSVYAAGLLAAAGQAAAGGAPGLALQLQQQAAKVFGDPSFDGSIDVKGTDWGFGANLALLWEIDQMTRVGASWRSSITHKLKGNADWSQPTNLPPEVLAAITGKPASSSKLDHNDSGASLAIRTHDSLSMHAFRQLDSRFAVMADATWYRYSTLETMRIDFDSTAAPSITAEHWKDAWRVSLGGNWKVAPALLLRAGVSFDKSPVDTIYRSPSLPDSDRTWYALGANFALSKQASVDLSFGYVKLKDAPMQATDDAEGVVPCSCAYSTVRGNYESSAKTVGIQLNYQF